MSDKLSNKALWVLAGILLITIIVYIPSLTNGFTNWDDLEQVVNNEDIQSLSFSGTGEVFSSFYVGMYQPLTAQLYAFIYAIFGENAGAFHGVSLLLHLLNTFLVFVLVRSFSRREIPALITAALFALNPLQTESVAWVSAMSNLLFSTFFLAGMITYIRYIRKAELSFYLLTLFWFILSLLAKPAAVTFPVVIVFLDLYFRRKLKLRLILEKLPFFIAAIAIGLVVLMARDEAGHIINISERFSFLERLLMVIYALAFYIARLFVPSDLSAFHPYPLDVLPVVYYIAPLIPIMILFMLYRLKGELRRQVMAGLIFFFITIVIVLELVPLGVQVVKERYVYLPSVGMYYVFAVLLLFFTERGKKRVWMKTFITACLALLFAVLSFARVQTWENSITLWNDVLEQYPEASAALINRGNAWQEKEDYTMAIADYNLAIRYEPMAADAYMNRGLANYRIDNYEMALSDFDKAIALGLNDAETYIYRGLLKASRNNMAGALQDFTQASIIDPKNVDAWVNMGLIQARLSKYNEALNALSMGVNYDPQSARAYYWRGMLLLELGKMEEGCRDLQKSVSLGWAAAKIPEVCR